MKNDAVYRLDADGVFVIENYHAAKPFSSFFPGIAGIWGIPMWVFYVNRGQCISSFGIESKDKAIMEFQPANKACRLVSSQGFRTFLKVRKGSKERMYEPFCHPGKSSFNLRQSMKITSHDLTLEEINTTLGLAVTVNYFTVPDESFSGLVRQVTIRNISRSEMAVDLIDGMPVILPYGQNDWIMKNMCRTIEAWYKVRNLARKAPYFQLDVEPADVPQVKHIREGNFYFAFDPSARPGALLNPIVDASVVFGQVTDFSFPEAFFASSRSASVQQADNRTPCAMSVLSAKLAAGDAKGLVSLTGFSHSEKELNALVAKVTARGVLTDMRERNRSVIDEIKSQAFMHSAVPALDAYCGQNFLDNVMRGGLPISLKTAEGPVVFNVYSRKHGDPERDYNAFRLAPTWFSQGNGNYRDVNQNRRNDIWFNQDLGDGAIVGFLGLIQADGYNPLIVCGMLFSVEDAGLIDDLCARHVKGSDCSGLKTFLQKGFMPGDLFRFLIDEQIDLKTLPVEFLTGILAVSRKKEKALHGEGFWVDHWTYNLDIIESYLAVYPEKFQPIMFDRTVFTFYQNSVYVLPRDKRYVLTPDGVRQYASLHEGVHNPDKGDCLRIKNGVGDVYKTTLLVKLLCLIANKASTFDPDGIGIEMEANKPGWYDSLNGLPGLLGSSIAETFELKRFSVFVLSALRLIVQQEDKTVRVFSELAVFISGLTDVLSDSGNTGLIYWQLSNALKEAYRVSIREGVSGEEKDIAVSDIVSFLEKVVLRVDRAVSLASLKNGLFPTYFYYEVTRYEWVDSALADQAGANVRPLAFQRHDLPLFLEGPVHALRSMTDIQEAQFFHKKIRASALFDKKLGMYKLNANISNESQEIGRTRVFPRGWLENETIWLHMEYKYLLELLRRGLYNEFYKDFLTACVPFMPAQRYGRSILENSSFIVSSVHSDKRLHGQGNVARLSGSTAEFVHMWMYMNAGLAPFSFSVDKGLMLAFRPALKGFLFTKKDETVSCPVCFDPSGRIDCPLGTYVFTFMGKVLVVYHNPSRKDTFGSKAAVMDRMMLTYSSEGSAVLVEGEMMPEPYAGDVRDGRVKRIDVYFR